MRIEADHVYQHDEYDEILVLGIQQRYEAYDTEENTGVEDGVYVRYTYQWDGYGAMFGATRVDPIDTVGQNISHPTSDGEGRNCRISGHCTTPVFTYFCPAV